MISIISSSSGVPIWQVLLMILAYFSALLVALSFHEFAHAFVAYKNGDPTAKVMGRLTLKPFSHFDAIGFISLVLFGFGWAKPVPVNFQNFKKPKKSGLLVSIAGVSLNLIMGLLLILLYALFISFCPQIFNINIYGTLLYYFLNYAILINFALAFFNILPVFPLDGFRVVETFASKENAYVSAIRRFGPIILILLLFSGLIDLYINNVAFALVDKIMLLFLKLFKG